MLLKTKEFKIPVCNIFKPKHYLDKLCYETDLQELKDKQNLRRQLNFGLTLVIDQNEERQFGSQLESPLTNKIYKNYDTFSIYVNTISMYIFSLGFDESELVTLDPVEIFEEGQYNLNNLKEISVTQSFMKLNSIIRNCQNNEKYDKCRSIKIENIRQECGCLPFSLRFSEEVKSK